MALWRGDWVTSSPGVYAAALVVVFCLAASVELLRKMAAAAQRSYWVGAAEYKRWDRGQRTAAKAVRAAVHVGTVLVGYLVMLAVMSYNLGVFVAAMAGFFTGFLLFADDHAHEGTEERSDATSAPGACH